MRTEHELRAGLRDIAESVDVPAPPVDAMARRGHGRVARRLTETALAVILVAGGFGWAGVALLRAGHSTLVTRPPEPFNGAHFDTIPVGGRAGSIAIGEDAVWVVRYPRGNIAQLVEIDPRTSAIIDSALTLPLDGTELVSDVAAGEGAVWVLVTRPGPNRDWNVPGRVLRIDPSSRRVVASIEVGRAVQFLTTGLGSVWVTNAADGTVSRISPATNRVVATIPVGADPGPIITGFGSVWVENTRGRTNVMRVDPTTNTVVATIQDVTDPIVGDEAVWVSGPGKPNGAVDQIDPLTNELTGRRYGLDISPAFVVAGDGRVWIAKWFYNPDQTQPPGQIGGIGPPYILFRLIEIDPKTLRGMTNPVTISGGPVRPTYGFGRIWVSSSTEGVLVLDVRAGN